MTTGQTCAGSQRQSVAHSLPPLWFLVTSPTVSTDLQLFTLAFSFLSSEESNAEEVQVRKADWASYTLATEHSIPLIPVNISVEESYQRFCGAMQKAARHSIPRGFRPTYTPCLDEECQDLLKQYKESGDLDIADHLINSFDADHLIESLDATHRHRWEELTSKNSLKPEELGTDTPAWCCSTTTQVNSSVSQRQCRCRLSHPGC